MVFNSIINTIYSCVSSFTIFKVNPNTQTQNIEKTIVTMNKITFYKNINFNISEIKNDTD